MSGQAEDVLAVLVDLDRQLATASCTAESLDEVAYIARSTSACQEIAALATTFQLLMWAGYSRLHRPHAVRHLDTLLRRQRAHERTAGLRLPTHSRDVARQVTRECGD